MSSAPLLIDVQGPIARLVLNRPEKHNAISLEMWTALPRLVAELEADRDVLAVVVTGAGGKAFCAGADIAEFGTVYANPETSRAYNDAVRAGQSALERLSKPTIAMVRGVCVGGGTGIALHCDLRFAADDARFGITPAKLGVAYSFGDTKKLVDTVGPARAKDILFSGRLIGAAEAQAIGLVDRLFAPGDLEEETLLYARTLCEGSQYSVRTAKAMIQAITDGADSETPDTRRRFDDAFSGEDFAEGRTAFLAKRKPVFGWRG
ncbi:MAG TPA: enoyl-CoA hydratase-related protein [Azospirillaceae bacterium]|nr:enoyl-CoA hydratase-related protein [Azospirillaceae bacterium]